jgi:acetyltransferase-like isoleucine patch superfamily enzyme
MDIRKLVRFYRKCAASNISVAVVAIVYLKMRFRGLNIMCCPGCFIRGIKNITSTGFVQVGMDDIGFMMPSDKTYLNIQGGLSLQGKVNIGRGTRLNVGPGGLCLISESYINARCLIVSMHSIVIGSGSLVSWDVMIIDDNFHQIQYAGREMRSPEIIIGKRVWIGARSTILSGTQIADGCVVAANSVVAGVFTIPNCLIAGNPARVIREDVQWG